jgi:hypothetical protein
MQQSIAVNHRAKDTLLELRVKVGQGSAPEGWQDGTQITIALYAAHASTEYGLVLGSAREARNFLEGLLQKLDEVEQLSALMGKR